MLYAHAEPGHDQDVIYVLCYIQSKFFIPGFCRIINDMKPCPNCIKLTKKRLMFLMSGRYFKPHPVSKSSSDPHQLKMNDEELLTWIHLVIDKLNNWPPILGAPLGITLTPNHVLLGL